MSFAILDQAIIRSANIISLSRVLPLSIDTDKFISAVRTNTGSLRLNHWEISGDGSDSIRVVGRGFWFALINPFLWIFGFRVFLHKRDNLPTKTK